MFYIEIPPLRERLSDLEDLVSYFRELFNLTFSKNITKVSDDAFGVLKNHIWPGNIRELKNTIERAMIFTSSGMLKGKELEIRDNDGDECVEISFPKNKDAVIPLKELEAKYIKHVLSVMGGNRTHTAGLLDISVPTLLSKIKEKE
jgi:transcriptional regulator with PAS, ATPase and Fis domain